MTDPEKILEMITVIFIGLLSLFGIGFSVGAVITIKRSGIGDWMIYSLCCLLFAVSAFFLTLAIIGLICG